MKELQKTIPNFSETEVVMYCPACGTTLDGQASCPRCGNPGPESGVMAPSTTPLTMSHFAALGLKVAAEGASPRPRLPSILTRTKPSASSPPPPSESEAERVVERELSQLDSLAVATASAVRADTAAFWSLKAAAILSSLAVVGCEAMRLGQAVMLLGLFACVSVVLDGAFPRGQRRSVHLRAASDLRRLQHEARSECAQAKLRGNLAAVAPDLLEMIGTERRRIERYSDGTPEGEPRG